MGRAKKDGPLYVVEHLEEGLGDWCRLEYRHVASFVPPERLVFLNYPLDTADLAPEGAAANPRASAKSLEELVPHGDSSAAALEAVEGGTPLPPWDRICLLDMDAEQALEPDDVARFDALVFGGILGNITENEDGSYGSDDRTAEIRRFGFVHRRHLGPMQMTTDTAVLVSQLVLETASPLAQIPFIDCPEFVDDKAGGTGVLAWLQLRSVPLRFLFSKSYS
ncbi:unnamed protein product [Polarella glacialis]|uniref:Uncharacterized protein n=1 Tax=Polarella glacialis TaxID=89957 RepID=A0A813I0U3_POLGL|nr:unnamed protein product [Polarella glacialis]